MVQDLYHFAPRTIGEAFRIYLDTLSAQQASLTKTALLRYVLPVWGAPEPVGKRLTLAEQADAMSLLDTIALEKLSEALDAQKRGFDEKKIDDKVQRSNRYRLKLFIDWVSKQGWLCEVEEKEVYSFSPKPNWKVRISNRSAKPVYRLKDSEISQSLRREIDDFKVFCKLRLNLRDATTEQACVEVKRFLGWMYHHKHCSLEELSLLSIVQKNTPHVVESTLESVYQYFSFLEDRLASQRESVRAIVKVAKYLYRMETKDFTNLREGGFRDIEVIQALRRVSREEAGPRYDVSTSPIPYEKRAVSWEKVIDVLKGLQKEVELTHTAKWNKLEQRHTLQKRSDMPVARSIQKLLIVAFFVTMPPDRNRTIRELEVGRTLVRGIFKDGLFISAENVVGCQTKWYIHLMPDDYKTGKSYGEYWSEVPNTPLHGGKDFYHYIDLWLHKYRNLFNPNHNFLFVKTSPKCPEVGVPLEASGIHVRVRTAFIKFTGIPVSPQVLRKMYITYLKNSRATEAELEAAATAMHHSREMQSKVYDQQTTAEKMQPIFEFNQNLFKKAFRET